jgi:hypothetical protein
VANAKQWNGEDNSSNLVVVQDLLITMPSDSWFFQNIVIFKTKLDMGERKATRNQKVVW